MTPPLVLGIAGGTGSGKTTVAHRIREALLPDVAYVDHDSYYKDQSHLSREDRLKVNYDHPDALDNELLADHVRALKDGFAIDKPNYDFATHARQPESTRVEPAPVVVVEGILTLALANLRSLYDIKIFVDTAADIRLMRRIRRDLEQRGRTFAEVRQQYYGTVRPMHLAFVEPSKRFADVIIPEGGENHIAIDLVVGRIRHFLRERQEWQASQDLTC
ncbi:MAG: uridine kinase [Myxococcales bacterium]|nr:uridine kinase [Myxococcales bacterium]